MKSSESSDDERTRTKKAKLKGAGAIAHGKKSKAAGKRAVIVDGPNSGNIKTGDTYYQKFIQQAARPGASSAQLRKGYLAWLCSSRSAKPFSFQSWCHSRAGRSSASSTAGTPTWCNSSP
jgi:hypothetical protein